MKKISYLTRFFEIASKLYRFLYGNILSVVFYGCSILAYYFGFVGGRYFIPIALIIGSFNFVYASYFYVKKGRRKFKFEDFIKPEVFQPYKKIQKRIFKLEIIILVFGVLLLPFYVFVGNYIVLDKDAEIQKIVEGLIDESMNETEKVDALLSWFTKEGNAPENFSSMYYRSRHNNVLLHLFGQLYIYDKEPYFCSHGDESPHWVITSKCGRCGDYAVLFTEMGRVAGLNVSTVHCIPEDHAWNEVYIIGRDEPLIIDATTVKWNGSIGYVSSGFMANKVAGDWRKIGEYPSEGNVSFVYCEFPNDSNNYNVTQRYTDAINITVNVTNPDGEPLSDVMVKVISYNRPDVLRRSCWGLEKKTNENGQCTFTLGGGRYKFIFEKDGDTKETEANEFWENNTQQYFPYKFESSSLFGLSYEKLIIIIIAIVIGFGLILYNKKKS